MNSSGPSFCVQHRTKKPVAFAMRLAAMALALAACTGTGPGPTPTSLPASGAVTAIVAPVTAQPTASLPLPTPPAPPEQTAPPLPPPTPAYDPFAVGLPSAEAQFAIPPAFQRVEAEAAVLYFALDPPTAGAVYFRGEGGPLQSVAFGAEAGPQVITLAGLTPATKYEVLVVTGQEPDYALPRFLDADWGNQSITTPPYAEPLRFASIADSGFGDPVTAGLADRLASEDIAFVLLVGDIVYRIDEQSGPAEAWRLKYFEPFAPVLRRMPIFPALGNHELDAPGWVNGTPYYYTAFPPAFDTTYPAGPLEAARKWYSFAYGGIQFLALNTQTLFGDTGREEQEAWIEERLADPAFAYTIPFFHIPPYSSALHYAEGPRVRPWADRFEAAGVPLVISGHDHVYERLAHGPTTYIVSGGGSGTVYQMQSPNEFSQVFASTSHYTLYAAYPDRIEVRALDADGAVIDEAVITVGG